MDTKLYTCHYCFEEYRPKRRYVQKFCSNTCRSKAYHIKNKKVGLNIGKEVGIPEVRPNKIERMSLPGIGNAMAGDFLYKTLEKALTSEANLSATKGDVWEIAKRMERYHKITNLALREDGFIPHYDMETKQVVYLPPFKRYR